MSPIGDALNRGRQPGATIGTASDPLASAAAADELTRMAKTDSELSRQIDAELSGAKVTFDGATSTITPDPDASPASATTSPPSTQPAATRPVNPRQSASTVQAAAQTAVQAAAIERIRLAREEQRDRDAASATKAGAQSTVGRVRERASSAEIPTGSILRLLPFILIALFVILGFDGVMTIFGAFFGIGAGLLFLFLILRLTTRTGRKTTDMPKENPFDQLQ